MSTVKVLCKLPAGLVLEVGYVMDYTLGRFVPTPAYKKAVLKGALRAAVEQVRAAGGEGFKMPENFIPSVTEVDEELAREWFRLHTKDYFVRNGLLAIVEKPADQKAMTRDVESVKTGFEPVKQEGDERMKGEAAKVEKADFAKEGWA